PHQKIENFLGDPPVQWLSGETPRIQINPSKQRIVVEHLFEVGHKPAIIGGIAMKSAADLIIESTVSHLVQGECCHVQCLRITGSLVVPKKERDRHAGGEFRCRAKSSLTAVESRTQSLHCLIQ